MNKVLRKRLCWNCESQVSVDVETCPVCGVSVIPAFLEGAGANFAPPYSLHTEKDFGIPKSLYDTGDGNIHVEGRDHEKEVEEEHSGGDDFKRVVLAVVFLLSGSVFLMFSLALGLFSRNDVFTLQWDGSYWYIYTLFAIPLLFLGWRSLMKMDRS